MMQYVTLALAIIAGVAGIIAAISVAGWNSSKKDVAACYQKLVDAANDKKAASLAADIEVKKREDVISMLKAELAEMEADLAANKDPAAVRARLGKLLSSPS